MPLRAPLAEALKEALRSRHEEPFEKSLGRAIRRSGGTYADYVDLMARVRERARTGKTDLRRAARSLVDHG